jgi:hypothetical protein
MDAPEMSFNLRITDDPKKNSTFYSIGNEKWVNYLADPFADGLPAFRGDIPQDLKDHLLLKLGPDTAINHKYHADNAKKALRGMVENDMAEQNKNEDNFEFFLSFAWEVMDGYGRLLCYVNRLQPEKPRPLDYNDRLLQTGLVCPYFIWPNIDPFREKSSMMEAVIPAGTQNIMADGSPKLKAARDGIKKARNDHTGIFEAGNELLLEPFKLRYLGRREAPKRWVIDLSKNDNILINPQEYYKINMEDRLFVDYEYIPLFVEKRMGATIIFFFFNSI